MAGGGGMEQGGPGRTGAAGTRASIARALRRLVTVVRVMALQGVIQALTAIGGILIVRGLDTRHYAYYTIAFSGIATLANMSSSGILDGAVAIGGRVLGERDRMAALVATALSLRRWLALLVGPPIAAGVAGLLIEDGAGLGESAGLLVLVGLALLIELETTIRGILPWLAGQFRELQAIELAGSTVRFVLVALIAALVPRADLALAASVVAGLVQLQLLRRRLPQPPPAAPDPGMRREIVALIRRQWLNDVNLLVQGQLGIWLLGLLATTAAVAEFGAFGRVAVVFSVITTSLHRTLLARYARARARAEALRWFALMLAASAALIALPLALALAFPDPVLMIFGRAYRPFAADFRLFCVNAALASLVTVTWWLNSSRAWIISGTFLVPFQSAALALLLWHFGAGSVHGMVAASIGLNLLLLATNLAYSWLRFRAFAPASEPHALE